MYTGNFTEEKMVQKQTKFLENLFNIIYSRLCFECFDINSKIVYIHGQAASLLPHTNTAERKEEAWNGIYSTKHLTAAKRINRNQAAKE